MKQLQEQELKPNAMTSDEVYVRRIYLDLVGRILTRKEAKEFFESEDPAKRRNLVSSLIGSDGYVSHQYNFWADLLRARTQIAGNSQSTESGYNYERWIKSAIRNNKPYDEMVYELVTASGAFWENPAVGYYLRDYGMQLDNLAMTTNVSGNAGHLCSVSRSPLRGVDADGLLSPFSLHLWHGFYNGIELQNDVIKKLTER